MFIHAKRGQRAVSQLFQEKKNTLKEKNGYNIFVVFAFVAWMSWRFMSNICFDNFYISWTFSMSSKSE